MRKFVVAMINIVAAIIAVISLSVLQVEYPNNTFTEVLYSPSFEKTDEFYEIVANNIDDIFTLVTLKNCFELNGELNYSLIVAETIDKNNEIKKWNIRDCLDQATKIHGLYIDNNFNVGQITDHSVVPFSSNASYNFTFKTYPSKLRTGVMTEEDFLLEFMYNLSQYHRCKFSLNDNACNFKYKLTYFDESNNKMQEYKNADLTDKDMSGNNHFLYLISEDNIISTNISKTDSETNIKYIKSLNPILDQDFILCILIDDTYQAADLLKAHYDVYAHKKNKCAVLITIIIYSSIVFLISLFLTIMFVLATKKTVDESKRLFYVLPAEFYFICYIVSITSLLFLSNRILISNRFAAFNTSFVRININLLIIYITTLLLILIYASKYANDTLTLASINKVKENYESNSVKISSTAFFFAIFIPVIILIILSIYLLYLFSMTHDYRILTTGIIMFFATIGFIVYILILQYEFNKALEAQVKSNEMRTSLIANVSHDIKTPLTSILNYTELISEEISNPSKEMMNNLEEYSKTIVNKSHRLNDLINDLIFDSKLTSGNVELDMAKLDLNAFITQVLAEFEEKLAEKNIKTIYNNNALKVFILADGSQLYRVFQNLFTNIYKYALENSRVYVDLESVKSKVIVTIKNIQKEKIEVDPDTLKDRFVRGSKSRSTEGFGLGLSISENLVKSMNGKLEITSIQDLFTVKIIFVSYED